MAYQWTVGHVIQQIVANSRNNTEIDRLDVRAVIKVLSAHPNYLDQHLLDILGAIHRFYNEGMIPGPEKERLIIRFIYTIESPKEQFCNLLCELFSFCSLTAIILFLRFNKFDELAVAIEEQRQIPPVIRENEISTTCNLFRYCNRIKLNFDNNIFHDCHTSTEQLGLMAEKRRQCLTSDGLGDIEMSYTAEEFIVTIWMQINTLRDDQFKERMVTLENMMQAIPNNIKTALLYARLIYFTKRAVTHALASQWNDSFDYIGKARKLLNTDVHREHFVTVLLYHDFMYIYRLRYAETCDHDDLQQAIDYGTSGIQIVQEISPGNSLLWVRLFKINMAMVLLAIGPKLDVNLDVDVSLEHSRKAKARISFVEERSHYAGISSREEIDFFMCKSRILREEGDLTRALEYARKAIEHSKYGTPFPVDKTNVQKYLNRLARRNNMDHLTKRKHANAVKLAIFGIVCIIFRPLYGLCMYYGQ